MIRIGLLIAALIAQGSSLSAEPVHVRATGTGADCWVLLHPLGMSGKYWDRRAKLLAEEHHVRLYAPDLPDHGRSAIVPRFDYDLATDAVAASLGRYCPRPRLIIGASSGGIVGMKLAARGTGKVAVVGVGSSFTADNVKSLLEQSRPNPEQENYLGTFAEQGEVQVSALFKSFGDLAALGTRPLLRPVERRKLSGRLLIINGGADAFFRPDSARRLARSIRGADLHILEGAQHLGPLADPYAPRTWALIGGFSASPGKRR